MYRPANNIDCVDEFVKTEKQEFHFLRVSNRKNDTDSTNRLFIKRIFKVASVKSCKQ